ncbi:MAG: BrnT family toxin [Terriglobia bacterium]
MKITDVIWMEVFVDKLAVKHNVTTQEAEDVLLSNPHIRRAAKGHVKGEHVYAAYGQTEGGRYLIVFFIYKGRGSALPISGRDMTSRERGLCDEQNEAG